ncbi:MAG: FtsX-like permease family protein [Oscillospiraceae bacterium]|nr:FtsX-like permease family protein [Oscillospiraceae bacterium]
MKKNTLLRNTLRRARRTKERFLSLFGIIAISTGFFAGLKASGPDMKDSAEQYYRETGLMDLHLLSNAGFCDDELDTLAERNDIAQLYGGYSETAFLPVKDQSADAVVQIYSLPGSARKTGAQINQPSVIEGRLPEKSDECLLDSGYAGKYAIGDTINIVPNDSEKTILSVKDYQIVGITDWSMYTSFERGTSVIGTGRIDCFLIVPSEAFDSEVYTDVFLTLTETANVSSFTDSYRTIVNDAADTLIKESKTLSDPHKQQILSDADETLSKARKELDDGWAEYEKGCDLLKEVRSKAEKELESAEKQLQATEADLAEKQKLYDASYKEYSDKLAPIEQQQKTLDAKEAKANGRIEALNEEAERIRYVVGMLGGYRNSCVTPPYSDDLQAIIDEMSAYDSEEFDVSGKMTEYFKTPIHTEEKTILEDTISLYLSNQSVLLEKEAEQIQSDAEQITLTRRQLRKAEKELDSTKAELEDAKAELFKYTNEFKSAKEALDNKKAELDEQESAEREKLDAAKTELESGEENYEKAVEAVNQYADGITWYAFDRTANPGWDGFGTDADRVDRIARIFPVFFILVAALVCLTTITRLVEEQRTEIGTFKALGYTTGSISIQFVMYAVLASVFGTAVGTAVGFQVFPRVIFNCYGMMYRYPQISCPFRWDWALICLAAAMLCTGAAAFAACYTTLRESPALLMRPKPPRKGKRILLEKFGRFWSKRSFRFKITARNFFRYRSRVLMTVIGICGSSALLVTGFGLYHAVSAIVDLQYEQIFVYDLLGIYDGSSEHHDTILEAVDNTESITDYQFGMMRTVTIRANGKSYSATLTVPDQPEQFAAFIDMRDRKTKSPLTPDDTGIIINEKLGKLLGIKAGESVSISGAKHTVQVNAVMESYTTNRIYMTPQLCRSLFGEYEPNCFYANEKTGTEEDTLAAHLLHTNAIQRLEFTSHSGTSFRNLVGALRYIVIVIIVFSGLLTFAVLYNLANINILERTRELASLKVLGYYNNEVYQYISRENMISSLCGIAVGQIAGIFLCRYVVSTAEVDVVMFAPDIPWYCFALSAGVTILFSLFVNLILRRRLRMIDMAASMKAVE